MEQQTRRPRTRRRQTLLNTAPIVLCIFVIGVIYLLTGCFGLKDKLGEESAPTMSNDAPPTVPVPDDTQPGTESPDPAATGEEPGTEASEPGVSDTEADSGASDTGIDVIGVDIPGMSNTGTSAPAEKTFTTVDASYFNDALFIGDSRTDGLRLYGSVSSGADFYCGTSMTIFGVLDSSETTNGVKGFKNVLQAKQYGKVYIMFGINECGYDTDYFLQWFDSVVQHIRSYQPNAIIYVQSILYVTQNHENAHSVFSTANLQEKNAGIAELANGEDIFYLEVNDALNDGTDHLPSDYTNDGVHLKPNYYSLWRDYLYEHAIVDEAHPWTAAETDAD